MRMVGSKEIIFTLRKIIISVASTELLGRIEQNRSCLFSRKIVDIIFQIVFKVPGYKVVNTFSILNWFGFDQIYRLSSNTEKLNEKVW